MDKNNNDFLSALSNPVAKESEQPKIIAKIAEEEHQEPNLATTGEEVALGRALLENDLHPVLIFGTRATGKTTFLASMLAFFTSVPDLGVTVTLGDQISNSEAGMLAHERAEKFFHAQVSDYISGTAPVLNQDKFPFFVPLELRKAGMRSITKIALMESSGELWDVSKKKNNVQELRSEIVDIYKNYTRPLSVITVVPYAMSEGYTGADASLDDKAQFQISDASLLQTLQIYQKYRPAGMNDQFYFVLTKWDMHTKKIASKEFINPDESLIYELVEQRFPHAYNYFRNMSQGHSTQCTPYSAGLIGGTRVLEVPRELRPLLQEFPYRLWRWIYANATQGGDLYGTGRPPRGGRFVKFFRELFS